MLWKPRSSSLVPLCSDIFLPRRWARHLYRRKRNILTAVIVTSTNSTRAVRVQSAFHFSGKTQANARLRQSAVVLRSPSTYQYHDSTPLPALLLSPGILLTALFSNGEDDGDPLLLQAHTASRSGASLRASLVAQTYTLSMPCSWTRLPSFRTLLITP